MSEAPHHDHDPVLGEYEPFADTALTDAERWPTLTGAGAGRLSALRGHPRAPAWVHECGDRLDAGDLVALADLHTRIHHAEPPEAGSATPSWAADLLQRAATAVPHYRRAWRQGPPPFPDVPTITRADLAADLASFVPVDVPLDDVLVGTSSGSTGAALVLPQHARTIGSDLVQLRRLVALTGTHWAPEPERLAVLSVVSQETAFTYASLLSAFDLAGLARINLHPSAWRRPGDREAFLTAMNPQVLTSTPSALVDLADLDVTLHPLAVISGATSLSRAARDLLRARWAAPVIDVYGLIETGPVAASVDGGPHRLLPRRQHVEVLDAKGRPVGVGQTGEVVVTSAENPYLPLLRYRTGDHARLTADGALADLEGRVPVRFATPDGTWVDAVGLTQVLQAHGTLAWHLHQDPGGDLTLRAVGGTEEPLLRSIERLLGRRPRSIRLPRPADLGPGKARRFSSALPGATP
ncbi:AMP-dependent synthetase [Occultella glacieicola]|uniref:AMP-dependent synthetase n=1 Tax=Occultella glacieicola TaxID=2518684 RepID=A0ABY2DXM5_9MICO|nr:AMP-binding protein [Occultella glacieicola]TDE88891.1 AMP-dependent synthetase [Occultella glacieicola]